jgi:hypothetical protein
MRIKTVRVSPTPQKVEFKVVQNQHSILMPMGDMHYGVADFPTERLKTNTQWAIDRGCLFLGMGDYLDFASATQRNITNSLRGATSEQIDDMVKIVIEEFYKILEPTTGKWIGLLEGNHRWTFQDATTADQYLCSLLKCDFLGTSAVIRANPTNAPRGHYEADTVIFAHHGIGSSRKLGGHLNRVEDLLAWIDADIYLMGHSHAKIFAPLDFQYITPDGIHTHRTKLIARTGSWYKGYSSGAPLPLTEAGYKSRGTYIEAQAYMPTALGSPCFGIGFEKINGSKYYKPAIHGSM